MTTTFSHPSGQVEAAVSALRAAGFTGGEPRTVTRTLLDTFDGRLRAAGIRAEYDGRLLTVYQEGSPTATVLLDVAPRFAADLPAGPLRARLGGVLEMRRLLPLVDATGVQHVLCRRNNAGRTVAAVTLTAAPVPGHAWVAEVAEVHGHGREADAAGEALRALGAEALEDGLLDLAARAAGIDVRGVDCSPTIPLEGDTPAIDGFVAVLTRLEECIDANWDGTIAELDTEFLHDLRVAVRRTRSVLRLGRKVLPDAVRAEFGEDFRWFGEITGRPRDLDVYLLEWDGYTRELPPATSADLDSVLAHLQRHDVAAHGRLVEAMRSHRAGDVRRRWRRWLAAPSTGMNGGDPLGKVAATRLRKAQKAVIDGGRAITDESPAEALHDLRKRAKNLRYLVECFGGLLPTDRRKAFVKTLKGLQDNLGEHQDTQIHADELRTIAHELDGASTDTILALGQLGARLEARRAAARAEFAARFAAYDTADTKRLVKELAEDMRR